ncbi:MAG: polya polymerase [Desulfobulbaceae bacterium]|nr:polya polymerase [Desulfobulbaceae bacterium]
MAEDLNSRKEEEERVQQPSPLIIQEADHPIRIKDIDKEALKVLYRLRDAGFIGFLVGGGVRDLYLGKKPKDFDISTDARPGQLRKLFRNSRAIGRRFRLVQVFFHGGKIIEVSTLRSQSEYDINGDKHTVLPANNTYGTLEDDAFRRDLTVNSLFFEIENSTIIDYVGGVKDLDKGVVRIVGEPERRVTRDPVRMMRAVRHASRNDFRIDRKSWSAIVENRDKLLLCPPSRIRDELLKDLHGGCAAAWLKIAIRSKILYTLLPFYEELISDTGSGAALGDTLLRYMQVIDRLHNSSTEKQPVVVSDNLLLASLLAPWIHSKFDAKEKLVGAAHHNRSRELRNLLDMAIGERFNLKRAVKENITTLFVNLTHLIRHSEDKNWPKWLQKKSYFTDCSKFFEIYSEVRGGKEIKNLSFREEPIADNVLPPVVNGRGRGYQGVMPTFSSSPGGIFGLRKH